MDYKEILKSDYFKETYAKIEELKKDFYVNHGFIHINGVINNAKYLADLFCLNPKQKESILDMASAPGGKTTQMAALSNNEAPMEGLMNLHFSNNILKDLSFGDIYLLAMYHIFVNKG